MGLIVVLGQLLKYLQTNFSMMCSISGCRMNPLKPNFTNFKCSTNYIKYSGLKKHVRQKPNLTRHQCEVCSKSFKNKLMKDFHKRIHLLQLPSKNCEDDLNTTNNLTRESKPRNQTHLQKRLQPGE